MSRFLFKIMLLVFVAFGLYTHMQKIEEQNKAMPVKVYRGTIMGKQVYASGIGFRTNNYLLIVDKEHFTLEKKDWDLLYIGQEVYIFYKEKVNSPEIDILEVHGMTPD